MPRNGKDDKKKDKSAKSSEDKSDSKLKPVLYDNKLQIIGDLQACEFAKFAEKSSAVNKKELKAFDCDILINEFKVQDFVDKIKSGKLHSERVLLLFAFKELTKDNIDVDKIIEFYKKIVDAVIEKGAKFVIINEPTPIPAFANKIDYWIKLAKFRKIMWDKIRQKNVFILRTYKLFVKRVYESEADRQKLLDAKKPVMAVLKDTISGEHGYAWTHSAIRKVVTVLRQVLVNTPKELVGNIVITNEDGEFDLYYESEIEDEDIFGDVGMNEYLISNVDITYSVVSEEESSSEEEDIDPLAVAKQLREVWFKGARIRYNLEQAYGDCGGIESKFANTIHAIPRLRHRDTNIMRLQLNCSEHIFLGLLDTGCSICIIDMAICEKIYKQKPEIRKYEISSRGSPPLKSAFGEKTERIKGLVTLPIRLSDVKEEVHIQFCIVKGLNAGCIIGVEAQFLLKSIISFRDSPEFKFIIPGSEREYTIPLEPYEGRYDTAEVQHIETECLMFLDNLNKDLMCFEEQIRNSFSKEGEEIVPICNINESKEEGEGRTFTEKLADITLNSGWPEEVREKFEDVCTRCQNLFREGIGCYEDYVHEFKLKDFPDKLFGPVYTIPRQRRPAVTKVVDEWLKYDVVKEKPSVHNIPLVTVEKSNGKVRVCGDFREFNKYVIPHTNLVPKIEEIKTKMGKAKFFTTIDCSNGFLQIKLHADQHEKCAFLYCERCYQFKRVPFGTNDSMAAFVAALQKILPGTESFTISYVDDLIIFSETIEDHLKHIEEILRRFNEANLTLNIEKCEWIAPSVDFLGFHFDKNGYVPNENKVKAIIEYPEPTDATGVLRFLGMVNFFRNSIPGCAQLEEPLNRITGSKSSFEWKDEQQKAFEKIKDSLANVVKLSHPDFERTFYINTDASHVAIGGVIYQYDGETPKPLQFTSRTLTSAERNYPIMEKELLAFIYTLKKCEYMLRYQHIVWKTDNIALKNLEFKWYFADRLKRWLLYMNMYYVNIEYIPGEQNVVADALSRCFASEFEFRQLVNYIDEQGRLINLQTIIKEQQKDPDIQQRLEDTYVTNNGVVFTTTGHIVVPKPLVSTFVQMFHIFYGHIGANRCIAQLQLRFYWPNMEVDIEKEINDCKRCKMSKARGSNVEEKPASWKPTRPFEIVATDLYGPLPMTRYQLRYILVFRDLYTRHVKFYSMSHATMNNFRDKLELYLKEIPYKVGTLLSDNARQYISKIWNEVCKSKGIKVIHTSPYAPWSNPAERVMRDLGDALRISTSNQHKQWYKYVSEIERNFNNTVHTEARIIPEWCVYQKIEKWPFGESILQAKPPPIETSLERINKSFEQKKLKEEKNANETSQRTLKVGDYVFVSNHTLSNKAEGVAAKLNPKFIGPYIVTENLGSNRYRLCSVINEEDTCEHHVRNLIRQKDRKYL